MRKPRRHGCRPLVGILVILVLATGSRALVQQPPPPAPAQDPEQARREAARLVAQASEDLRHVPVRRLSEELRDAYERTARLLRQAEVASREEPRGLPALALARQAADAARDIVTRALRLDAYADAVGFYRRGDPVRAASVLAAFTRSELLDLVTYVSDSRASIAQPGTALETWDQRMPAAAAMLHTELAARWPTGRAEQQDECLHLLRTAGLLLAIVDDHDLPDRFKARWTLAVAAYLQRQLFIAAALEHVAHAVAAYPRDADIILAAGALSEMMAQSKIILPTRVDAGLRSTLLRQQEGGLELAAARYKDVLALVPGHPEAHLRVGRVLQQQGRAREALEHFAVASRAPDQRVAYLAALFTARVHHDARAWPRAAAAYRVADRVVPGCQAAVFGLSVVLRRLGESDEAAAVVRQTLPPAPDAMGCREYYWEYDYGPAWRLEPLLAALRADVR